MREIFLHYKSVVIVGEERNMSKLVMPFIAIGLLFMSTIFLVAAAVSMSSRT
jgi:hypothetical protein